MKIVEVIQESQTSSVEKLKRKLIAAKGADRKLDYDAIDRMMREIAGNGKKALQKLHDDFVDQCGSIPDKWIVKQDVEKVKESSKKYLGPDDKVRINKDGWQIPLNKRGFGV